MNLASPTIPGNVQSLSQFSVFTPINFALVVLIFLVLVFSLLIFRQARQMTEVLPTPLSPFVHLLVIAFAAFSLGALILGIGILYS
jgi:ABC-type multidrug transport system permease subunit